MKCAAIDIGTNTILLLIAEKNGEVFHDILDVSTIVRLGEGLVRSGSLKEEAISRTIDTLGRYLDTARSNGVQKMFCIGTAALRNARNGREFTASVKDMFGLDIEIISAHKEAYYTYLSVCNDTAIRHACMTIIDIGGGSTEIIDGTENEFSGYVSLPIGSVVLTDSFISHDPPENRELDNVAAFIRNNLGNVRYRRASVLVGTGGTVTNIAALILGMPQYDKSIIHGYSIDIKDLKKLIFSLASMKSEARKACRGMEAGREDIIVQGAMILEEIMMHGGFDSCIVSAAGAGTVSCTKDAGNMNNKFCWTVIFI